MHKKSKQFTNKSQVVSSMFCKLADSSAMESALKKRSKRKAKPIFVVSIIFCLIFILAAVYFAIIEDSNSSKPISIAELTANNSPLHSLNNAFRKDSISVDLYGLYLRDLLIRYDSLPDKYKLEKPIISRQDVFQSLTDVWIKLDYSTQSTIIKDLPDLNKHIEKHKD